MHCKTQPPDVEALKALCTECGFHRFRDELADKDQLPPKDEVDLAGRLSHDRHARAFRAFLDELQRQPRFCIDTETTAIDPLRADLVGLSFCWQAGEAYYLPLRGPAGSPAARRAGDPRGPAADPERPGGREGRPEHQVRHAGARARGRRAGRAGHRHDGPVATCSKAASATTTSTSCPSGCSTTR